MLFTRLNSFMVKRYSYRNTVSTLKREPCSTSHIACTGFFGDCARRCPTRRIACICSFCGCAGTLHSIANNRACLGHGKLSLLHSLLFPFAFKGTLLVLWPLSFSCFRASRLLPHLPHHAAPLLPPRLPSITCVAKDSFLTHFLFSMPAPAFELS